MKKPSNRRGEVIAVQIDPRVVAAIDTVAERQFRTRSDIVRQAVLKELEACGVCPAAA